MRRSWLATPAVAAVMVLAACGNDPGSGSQGAGSAGQTQSTNLSGTVVVKRATAAAGFDDVAAIDTAFNRMGIPMHGRKACYSSGDYNSMASNLAGASGSSGRAPTLIAWALARAAFRRQESRGGHFRTDFPHTDPSWRVRQAVSCDGWSRLVVE